MTERQKANRRAIAEARKVADGTAIRAEVDAAREAALDEHWASGGACTRAVRAIDTAREFAIYA